MLLAFAMQIPVWLWFVDDAAISFSYARNFADGEGLVAQPGGERVEGYSNPLWVFLLSLWELAGIGGFISAKIMGVLLAVATIPLVWAIARWSRPDRDEAVPLLAAFALAANAQFAIWNTSGLENALFSLLLAGGIWRTLVETRTRGFPWSALLFLGVSVTRPEGIAYAAAGGFAAMVFALQDGRGLRPTLRWLLVFFLPFCAYHALRIHYFAWPFPNTYYAKLAHKLAHAFDWDGRGWRYVLRYAGLAFAKNSPGPGLGQGYLLPVYLVGALGAIGKPGRAGGRALALCWAMAAISVAFAVGSNGDWMPGYRWLAFLCVPASVLFATGVGELRDRVRGWVQRRPGPPNPRARLGGTAVAVAATALFAIPQARHLHWFTWRAPTSATAVRQRVDYLHHLMDTLQLERAAVLDIDMGAHLFWSRADMIDMGGLIDVPFAHHQFDAAFIREYLFQERRPEFAHVHGAWAEKTHIPDHPEWSAEYVALPGYLRTVRGVHTGNHVRRNLLLRPRWEGEPGRRVVFRNGATLAGWELPGLPTAPGLNLFVTLGLARSAPPEAAAAHAYQVEIFLADADGVVARRVVAPGYGWLPPSEWRAGEVFRGHFTLPLTTRVPPGAYDLGFLLRDDRGRVVPALAPAAPRLSPPGGPVVGGVRGVAPLVAAGEVRFPRAVAVAPFAKAMQRTRANFEALAKRAEDLDCPGAEARWLRLRRRLVGTTERVERYRPAATRALAECWARRALASSDRGEQIAWLVRARELDHRAPSLRAAAHPLADALFDEGKAAREREAWEEAYRLFTSALRVEPSRSWARRYAEEARAHRLGLKTPVHAW
jgi:hypothetical protein